MSLNGTPGEQVVVVGVAPAVDVDASASILIVARRALHDESRQQTRISHSLAIGVAALSPRQM